MSGPTINDVVGADKLEASANPEQMQAAPLEETKSGLGMDLSFLKAPTGAGSIESYIEHPMNFNNSKSLAQVIRGFTGMLGSLDLAIIDIVIGGLNFAKERKPNAHTV